MFLNTIQSIEGTHKPRKRVGRGIGCTFGKTCGRGHKGQKARSGGFHKVGFEGGQMPLQRRLPKVGFKSQSKKYKSEVRLSELNNIEHALIDLKALISSNIVPIFTKSVKIINSGKLNKVIHVKGLSVTASAMEVILSLGGKVEV